jgi:enoyl-CoA hydratase/carnithine racemase
MSDPEHQPTGGGAFVPHMTFDDYRERYKESFVLKRKDGIIEVRAHSDNGPASWTPAIHQGWCQLFTIIGNDPENEVLIITGTGDKWIAELDEEFMKYVETVLRQNPAAWVKASYDGVYMADALLTNLIWDIHIPTIGVINGPAPGHTEFPLACDLTLCAEDAAFQDPHFVSNVVPGDGQFSILQKLLGDKRANYAVYMGTSIDAETALDLGVVNEVLPRERLLPRAWEIAAKIMEKDRYVRRLTHDLMRQSMRRHFTKDGNLHRAMEAWGQCLAFMNGSNESFSDTWRKTNEGV